MIIFLCLFMPYTSLILASIQFAASTASVNEGDNMLQLTLKNSATASGTVCKYTLSRDFIILRH